MSDKPPTYDAAVGAPSVNVTNPTGEVHRSSSANVLEEQRPAGRGRATSDASVSTMSTSGYLREEDDLVGEEGRRSMDDERRELPKGWVRCFDPKTEHHFYVDEATKRSSWIHPYDDPEYLRTLPDTHPANPKSVQAQAIRKRAEDEELMAKRMKDAKEQTKKGGSAKTQQGGEDRNWIQRQKDKLVGTKEERAAKKEEKRKAQEAERKRIVDMQKDYMRRRQELLQKQLNDPATRRLYAADPYGYAAPSSAYSRGGGLYGSPYGYGYDGGYGRRYGYGGGMGMGMGMPLFGGLAGGMLLGSAMSGGFGGGFGGGCGGGCGGGGGGCGGGGGM